MVWILVGWWEMVGRRYFSGNPEVGGQSGKSRQVPTLHPRTPPAKREGLPLHSQKSKNPPDGKIFHGKAYQIKFFFFIFQHYRTLPSAASTQAKRHKSSLLMTIITFITR